MRNLFSGRLFRNRRGAILAAVAAAVLAAVLLVVYLNSYRSSVDSGKRAERVLVATALIPRGTSGDLIARKHLYQVTTVQKDQLKNFAISDPGTLNDRVSANDIFPGQQLTQSDFSTEVPSAIPYQLTGPERAIAIPFDSSHGMIGQVSSGDFVDVYVGVSGDTAAGTVLTLLASNILVLVAPSAASGSNAVLRVPAIQIPKFALAADNARLWLVLRPKVGATKTPPTTATLSSLLAGGK